jgi:hypothetical protein
MLLNSFGLKQELTEFLRNNGVEFFGVEGPGRGSKICTVLVKHDEVEKIKALNGKNNKIHEFHFTCSWWLDTTAKYIVNCKKI